MALTDYVTLGQSGLKVSPFCFGAMTFGNEWGFGSDEPTSKRILDEFLERGGNFIDTSNFYTQGHSERIIGEHIGQHPAKRSRAVIATKFSANMAVKDPNAGGASRKSIISACEDSLRRLKTDYIDLYWLHWDDPFTPLEETLSALNALVRGGKVRYIGISDTPAWKISRAHTIAGFRGWANLIAIQIEYSLLERTVEGDLIPMAVELGLGITSWGPLRAGVLSGKYTRDNMRAESPGRAPSVSADANEHTFEVLDVLHAVARRHDTSAARVALAWVRGRPGVTAPIIGARTEVQLQDNLAAFAIELDDADLEELNGVSAPRLSFPHAFLKDAVRASYPDMSVNGQSFKAYGL
jgi:aryl-alcohol dehydrogenase-like predicted oxidoreductase